MSAKPAPATPPPLPDSTGIGASRDQIAAGVLPPLLLAPDLAQSSGREEAPVGALVVQARLCAPSVAGVERLIDRTDVPRGHNRPCGSQARERIGHAHDGPHLGEFGG